MSDSELKDNIYKKISKKSEKSKAHFLLEIKGKLRKERVERKTKIVKNRHLKGDVY